MKLLEATAAVQIDAWANARQPAWTNVERAELRAGLMALSDAVTPHIVADIPLLDADAQRFLLLRSVGAINDALTRAAAGMRRALRIDATVPRKLNGTASLGLRSASTEELDALPGIGPERARDLARALARHSGMNSIDRLDAVEGVGVAMLQTLKTHAHLEAPWSAMVSPTLLAFCQQASMETALHLFEHTDMELFTGDTGRLERHQPLGGTPAARLLRLLRGVHEQASASRSPLSGALASQATKVLAQNDLRDQYLARLHTTDGAVLLDAAYRQTLLEVIAASQQSLDLAVFLATASRHQPSGIGSEDIVTAMEARAAAGVAVRVLLDHDRPEDPYRSGRINAPLVRRLQAAGVAVKLDRREVLLHSKFLVSDRQRVVVGSHNLTTSSIMHTHELSLRLDAPEVAMAFAMRFDALWAALP